MMLKQGIKSQVIKNNLNKSRFTYQFGPNMSQTLDKFNELQSYFK